jgi:AcrR family transcriptional regulator
MSATGEKRRYRMAERADAMAKTRAVILEAAIEIGDPRVPLARIAERADVSQRTILRYFGDRAGLFAAVLQAGIERVEAERFGVPVGDVDAAAANLVAHYELRGDQVIARLAAEGGDERIDEILDTGRSMHRRWVTEKLGPLLEGVAARARRRRLAQLVAVTDVYTWKLLRRDSGLGVGETEKAITELIRGVTDTGERE